MGAKDRKRLPQPPRTLHPGVQYRIRLRISRPGSFSRPFRKVSSTKKAYAATLAPRRSTRSPTARAVPPVAFRAATWTWMCIVLVADVTALVDPGRERRAVAAGHPPDGRPLP